MQVREIMPDPSVLAAREEKAPLWARLAPLAYLAACVLAARAAWIDHLDVGATGLLAAVGLFPAFVLPCVFSTRAVTLGLSEEGLVVDGRLEKVDEARVERAMRGAAVLRVATRSGATRTFHLASYDDAARLVAKLPPVSAPAGALAA